MTATPSSLTGFITRVGTPSASQSFDAAGSNLTASITITAPAGYQVSLDKDLGYANSVTIAPVSGTVASTSVFVRLTGASAGSPSGNVTVASTGATTQNVAVSGTVNAPALTAAPSSLSGFSTTVGTPSAAQSFNAGGTNLGANITITAPTGYQVSLASGSGYAASLTLTPTDGTVDPTPIFVRLTGASAGSPSGNVTVTSTGATARNVSVSGTVIVPPPVINVSTATLTNFSTTLGTPSAFQSFTAGGTNLTANITVTAPTNFAISFTTNGTGVGASLVLTNVAGVATNRTIFVRMTGATEGSFTNAVRLASGTASNSVAVAGTVTRPVLVNSFVPPRAMVAGATNTNLLTASVVRALGGDATGRVYIGGDFNRLVRSNGATLTTNTAVRVARLLTDGSVDGAFNVGEGPNASVRTMVVASNTVLLGGNFTTFAGSPRVALARVDAAGKLDTAFNPNITASVTANPVFVQSILVQPDGKILIGGSFARVGGVARANLARLNANGTLDAAFNVPVDGAVNTIARQTDGKILIGGSFSTVSGAAIRRIARLNPEGTLDTTFNVGRGTSSGFNATVQSISVSPTGAIYVAGSFTSYKGASFWRYLAQLDPLGNIVSPFNYLGGLNGPANRVIAVPGSEDAMVAGEFTSVANSYLGIPTTTVGRLTQFLKSGALAGFNSRQTGANGPIIDAVLLPTGQWLIAGSFTSFNGVARSGLAMLNGPAGSSVRSTSSAARSTTDTPVANTPLLAGVPLDALADGDVNAVSVQPLAASLLDPSAGNSLFLHLDAAKNSATSSAYLYSAEFSSDLVNWSTNGVKRVFEDPSRVIFRPPFSLGNPPGQYLRLKVLAP